MATGNARKHKPGTPDEVARVESAEIVQILGRGKAGAIAPVKDIMVGSRAITRSDLPLASEELAAALRETGGAVNVIIDEAERVLDCEGNHRAYRATVQSAMLRILEVCAFEDLTGQRIAKVAQVLKEMEGTPRSTDKDLTPSRSRSPSNKGASKARLDGPALDAPHMSQADIDAIFSD